MKPQSPKGAGEQTEKLRQKLACEREGKGGRLRPSVATVCLPPLRPGTRAVVDLGTDRVCVLQTGGRGSERGGTCSEPRSEGVPSSPSPSLGRPPRPLWRGWRTHLLTGLRSCPWPPVLHTGKADSGGTLWWHATLVAHLVALRPASHSGLLSVPPNLLLASGPLHLLFPASTDLPPFPSHMHTHKRISSHPVTSCSSFGPQSKPCFLQKAYLIFSPYVFSSTYLPRLLSPGHCRRCHVSVWLYVYGHCPLRD